MYHRKVPIGWLQTGRPQSEAHVQYRKCKECGKWMDVKELRRHYRIHHREIYSRYLEMIGR